MKKIILLFSFIIAVLKVQAQETPKDGILELPPEIVTAITTDDPVALAKLITKENISACYGNYSILSHTIRHNAKKCFDVLIDKGANVNQICAGYVPPIMHAVKYGRLDMLKVLIAKGADKNYHYDGDDPNVEDMTPLSYAEKFKQTAIIEYLKSLK